MYQTSLWIINGSLEVTNYIMRILHYINYDNNARVYFYMYYKWKLIVINEIFENKQKPSAKVVVVVVAVVVYSISNTERGLKHRKQGSVNFFLPPGL